MRKIFLALLLLGACVTFPETWEDRFRSEFDFNHVDARTPVHQIAVRFPCWLDSADEGEVLTAIDEYWDMTVEMYPGAVTFPIQEYMVYIHDAPGAFVLGNEGRQMWCHGWTVGRVWVVSWSWHLDDKGRPDGIRMHDPLMALPHEFFHSIFEWEKAWGDPGHMFFGEVSFLLAMIGMNAPEVDLSWASVDAVKRFRYVPWCCPQPNAK